MRKSEHTELASLSRLAVLASRDGLNNITYGSAAAAAHLSKGAIQRLFPDKAALQSTVLAHVVKLMRVHLFEYDYIEAVTFARTRERWADWISGDSGLPGGCVLLAAATGRGYSGDLLRAIGSAVERLLSDLSALAMREKIIKSCEVARFKRMQLGSALELHVAQFVLPQLGSLNTESRTQRKLDFVVQALL